MEALFLKMLNLTVTGGWVILAVLAVRALLWRAPKKYRYLLWSVVGFRLCCPVSFQSWFSVFSLGFFDLSRAQQGSATVLTYVPADIGMMPQPQVTVGVPHANQIVNGFLPAATPAVSVNPMQIWVAVGTALWCAGMAALILYSVVSLLRLWFRLRTAVRLEGNVWQSEAVRAPFILGLLRPKIYLPYHLSPEAQRCVLAHERCHLKRLDHVVKPLAYCLLVVHWMNPLCWLAFYLFSRDMEMRCDEWVLAREGAERTAYSATLLSFGMGRRFPAPVPLAFGESGVKTRIKNALNWTRPASWVTVLAVVLCVSVLAACAANPQAEKAAPPKEKTVNLELVTSTPRDEAVLPEGETVYQVTGVEYCPPEISFRRTPANAPQYCITGEGELFVRDALSLEDSGFVSQGFLTKASLTEDNFDRHFSRMDYSDFDPGRLRAENKEAWTLTAEGEETPVFYDLLLQEDDSLYLAYGYLGDGGQPGVLWVFRLAAVPRYRTDQCLFMNPLSSTLLPDGDNGFDYYLGDHQVLIVHRADGAVEAIDTDWAWQDFPWSREEWESFFVLHPLSYDGYKDAGYLPLGNRKALLRSGDTLLLLELRENREMGTMLWAAFSLTDQ